MLKERKRDRLISNGVNISVTKKRETISKRKAIREMRVYWVDRGKQYANTHRDTLTLNILKCILHSLSQNNVGLCQCTPYTAYNVHSTVQQQQHTYMEYMYTSYAWDAWWCCCCHLRHRRCHCRLRRRCCRFMIRDLLSASFTSPCVPGLA